jgi:GNAT superfamily N-acetyltransferase
MPASAVDGKVKFREFRNEDAEFCFKTRSAAFIEKFYDEIGPQIVSLCVNAYMPDDYIEFARNMKIFILEDSGEQLGFVTVKRIEKEVAEIPLIYLSLDSLGKGYGRRSIEYIEEWVKNNWQDVNKLFVDTIVPNYNGGFYQKMNFIEAGESVCVFSGKKVRAKRFEKLIR